MLEGLDAIDWATASHAYGEASDVPGLIRALLSTDEATRDFAAQELFSNIWHQGTVYPAAVHALPFLIELLESDETPDRETVALLVASILNGRGYCEVHFSRPLINPFTGRPIEPPADLDQLIAAESETVARVRQIGRRAVLSLLPYLKHSDSGFRAVIARAFAHQPAMAAAIVPALTAAFAAERDAETRRTMGVVLDSLAERPG